MSSVISDDMYSDIPALSFDKPDMYILYWTWRIELYSSLFAENCSAVYSYDIFSHMGHEWRRAVLNQV